MYALNHIRAQEITFMRHFVSDFVAKWTDLPSKFIFLNIIYKYMFVRNKNTYNFGIFCICIYCVASWVFLVHKINTFTSENAGKFHK